MKFKIKLNKAWENLTCHQHCSQYMIFQTNQFKPRKKTHHTLIQYSIYLH